MKKNIVLLLGAVLFVIVIAEILLQLMGVEKPKLEEAPKSNWARVPERVWTEHHRVLGWYHQKKKQALLTVPGGTVEVHTNSLGFRGRRDYSVEREVGVARIAVLGDSFTFGFGVEDQESFCARLEERYSNLEVINLGIPGYGIDQIFLSYQMIAKKLRPDYVLIGFFPEQLWRATRSFADSGHAKPYFSINGTGDLKLHNVPVPKPFQLKTNQFPDLMEYSFVENALMKSLFYRWTRKAILKLGKEMGILDPDLTVEWILGRGILLELVQEIRQDGSEPVLLLLPPDRWVKSMRKTSLRKSLLRFAEREQIQMLDLTPEFQEAVQKDGLTDYYIDGDWHWTPQGHLLAADIMEGYLKQRGFLKEE